MKNKITLIDSLKLAINSHGKTNQMDKSGLTPYYWHLLRVMIRLGKSATEEQKHIAILHDILEDTNITEKDLIRLGYSQSIIDGIKMCSNIYYKDITYNDWMIVLSQSNNTDVKKVKVSDISDNLSFEPKPAMQSSSFRSG